MALNITPLCISCIIMRIRKKGLKDSCQYCAFGLFFLGSHGLSGHSLICIIGLIIHPNQLGRAQSI